MRAREMLPLIEEASKRVYALVEETPLVALPAEATAPDAPIAFAKLEQLQRSGSFKLRGATNKLMSLSPGEAAAGVIASSTGNHGLGVATAAHALGIDAEVFLSAQVSAAKRDKITAHGARVRVIDGDPLTAELAARAAAGASGRTYISPYNDAHVVAGQGTIGLELLRQLPDVDAVYIATGGGGLLSGIGSWLHEHRPGVELVGCWPENSAVLYECLKAGRIIDAPERPTLSESTAGGVEHGSITFELAREVMHHAVLVSEAEILEGMRFGRAQGWSMEGAGGVALAACFKEAGRYAGRKVVVLICGGNPSPAVAERLAATPPYPSRSRALARLSSTRVTMKYSNLVERVTGEGADAWATHYAATAAKARGEDVVILSIGDPDLETPPAVTERAIERLKAGDTHYTPIPGREPLREAIAERHRERTGQAAEAANVLFCAGAQNALFCASMCLAGSGDEIIAFEPLYPTYPATLQATGARMVRVRAPADRGFRIDLAGLESAISPRTRAIFFATPNNPSGVIASAEELQVIGDLARRHSLWVVTDEVYAGLAPGGRVPSLAQRLPEQVVTIASLSKTHAMPGWRAGWMVAPKPLIGHVEALALCMLYGLPGFIQEAALTAVSMAAAAEERTRDFCGRRRDFVLAALAGVPQIRCLAPEAGMFMLIDVRGCGLSGHEFMTELYREEKVSVLDGGAFGRDTADFVRLCYATDETSLREACVRIRRFAQRRH